MSSDVSSNSAAAAAVSRNKQQSDSKLVPAIYSDSPVLAITVPIQSNITATEQQSIQHLVSSLQAMGCELLRIDSSNSADVMHARPSTHRIVYIIYNKSYDASELSAALGSVSSEYVSQFQSGFDLNTLLSQGEEVWNYMDHLVCLDGKLHPNLAFFVDIAQLDADVLKQYEQYVKNLSSSDNQSPSQTVASSSSSSAAKLPPPPNVPPSIPAPSLPSSSNDELSFTFTSWNTLSQDYAHPSSFFYIEPCYLNFQHRGPLIRATLDKHAADVECLQEVDYDAVDQGLFDSSDAGNYSKGSVFLRRPASKRDGCLIRWDDSKFQLQEIPHLQILDATFAKHSTERKKDTLASRIQCKEVQASNLHPRSKKEKEKMASAGTSASVSNAVASPPQTAAQRSGHNPEKSLFKRQMHVMHSISQLEERLDSISQQLNEKLGRVEPISSIVEPCPPPASHAHVVPPSQEATYFHAVHLNDLSLLTRSKKNCTSSLFARFKRENIGLIILLKLRQPSSSQQEHLFLVSNVHLFWNPEFEDVKLSQCVFLMQQLSHLRTLVQQQNPHAKIHTVLGGDYNSIPNSAVYNFITQGSAAIPQITYFNAVSMAHSSSSEPIASSNLHEIVFAKSPDTTADQTKENEADEEAQQSSATVSSSTTPDLPAGSSSSSSCSCQASSEVMERFSSHPNVHTKLLLDSTLLKVTKWLRAIGVDTICQSSTHSTSDPEAVTAAVEKFFTTARKEKRIIVTQNKALLLRRGIPTYYNLPSALKEPIDIFLDICAHFNFEWHDELFYHRCTTCNHVVLPLRHAEFKLLPFLPSEYTTGMNDDGEPLEITRCQGRGCSRVRWWSSKRQKHTRSKLFQVRMDIDVEMEEIFSHQQEKEYVEQLEKAEVEAGEEKKQQKAAAIAAAATTTSKANDSSSSSSSTTVTVPIAGPPSVPISREEVAAQRAARKAMKSASKARSQDADRLARKAAHISRIDFEKTALLNSLHGADGEYLFDVRVLSKELSPIQQEMKLHSQQVMRIMETANAATAAGEQLEDALLQASQNLASSPTVALWWTNEKKAKMIEVEMRIIEETRKTMLQRRRRKAKEARETASRGTAASAVNSQSEQQHDDDDTDSPANSPIATSASPQSSGPTFAQQLHRYWQDAVDTRAVSPLLKQSFDETQAIDVHEHQLKLSSAYLSQGEPEFTNKTANFTDTIDYLFYSADSLRVQRVRPLSSKAELEARDVIGYPTQEWPSDHELIQVTLFIKS